MPKVSIIVTAYNIERYIDESLASISGQTLRDIEIIVVDDGSTDRTPQIIRDHAARDSRIKPILFTKNTIGGVASAANAGMDVATGDFIGFADGDDRYVPEMFEKLYDAAVQADADLAMCRYMLLDESDGQLKEPAENDRWNPYTQQTVVDLDLERRREMLKFISVPWRKLYRRDLVERAGLRYPVGDFFFEDNPFHWMAVIEANRMVLIPERLCDHRVGRVGQTMATVDDRLLRIFQHHDIILEWLHRTGHDADFRMDLLRWVAAQLSWVSLRAEGDIQRKLYDVMVPIIGIYSSEELAEYGQINGRGRTVQMLEALRAEDYERFSSVAGWNNGQVQVTGAAPASASLFGRGMYHLRNTGLRQTLGMTATYARERLGIPLPTSSARRKRDEIDNRDLMLALVVLQKELRGLRAELAQIKRDNAAGSGRQGK